MKKFYDIFNNEMINAKKIIEIVFLYKEILFV